MAGKKGGIQLFGAPSQAAPQLLAQAARAMQAGQPGQARQLCRQILGAEPRHAGALHLLGLVHAHAGEHAEAARCIQQSIDYGGANPAAFNNLGIALRNCGRLDEAVAACRQALALKPDYADAQTNLANALLDQGHAADALALLDEALRANAERAATWHNRGNALLALGRNDDAAQSYAQALRLEPKHARALVNRGRALCGTGQIAEAVAHFDQALALNANDADALLHKGSALLRLNHTEQALAHYRRSAELAPDMADAWHHLGQALLKARHYAEAIGAFTRLHALQPDYPDALGDLLHAHMLACDWRGVDELRAAVSTHIARGERAAEPFGLQGTATSESELLACARLYAADEYPAQPAAPQPPRPPGERRITLGYVCGEFRQQATTILMAGVYEAHDKSRFRLVAFDNGDDDGSDYRRRVEAAFDAIVPIRALSDAQAAERIAREGVDILIHLNGYYGEERTGVFAHRPAPVQVNYLGFPGTLGADYIDYLVADETVIPADSRRHYAEQVVWLPHSYQANDAQRRVAPTAPTRAEAGLPENAFVFACFNNAYKITPETFDVWMRILAAVPGSVLWLLEDHREATQNLRREAQARGVAGDRLVFAGRLPPDEHLARHRLADLFLDTLPYNAHTTASDALWAGLPLLTTPGGTFPGRVAASLLKAVGLPELIAPDLPAYEALAVQLAGDPERLAALRNRLAAQRREAPLFDTARFTRALERAFEFMHARHQQGLAPALVAVADDERASGQ